jgi:glucose/arabinose dehydrogenase
MRTNISITLLAALLIAGGCKGNNQQAGSASTPSSASQPASTAAATTATTPEELGALGAEIKKHPNDAHKLIAEHGLTEESFAAAVRKVSEDPAAAKRYAMAFKQSNS